MANPSGYSTTAPVNGPARTTAAVDTGRGSRDKDDDKGKAYWTLQQCKQAYLDYAGSKSLELEEIKEARRYRHHSQWTNEQVEILNKRKQPVVTYPRIGRKIDGIVGTLQRLKQDPKAYPRTPKQEQGAELATAVLRYALESQQWDTKMPIVADMCATDGHSGIELELIEGDKGEGDKEVGFNIVEEGYFYDPRSFRLDFSDARYQGVSKLLDIETAIEMLPDSEDDIRSAGGSGGAGSVELSVTSDRDSRWFTTIGRRKFIRLVELWYQHRGGWCYAIFTGSKILVEGASYFTDEKQKTISKYLMFRCSVDHDGDSYGFIRALKSPQDEINQRRSKGLHILNTRRLIAEKGAFDDVELTRREAARPDGVVERNPGFAAEFDDQAKQLDLAGQLKFLEDAKAEIDNYGPSQVVTGEGVDNQSGRAIQLRQNAAMAELGPYLLSYRGWKLRVYKAVFCAIQKHWTTERWVRVTDDDGLAQFIGINATKDENGQPIVDQYGNPTIANVLGQVDVDIILDEGPDTINQQADFYETMKEIVPSVAKVLPPPKVSALMDSLIANSPLPAEAKKKYNDVGRELEAQPPPPNPEVLKAQAELQIEQQKAQQDTALKAAAQQQEAKLDEAKAIQEITIERAKAAAQIEIAQQKAQADIAIAEAKARQDAQMKAFNADVDREQKQLQFKFDSNMKRRELGETVDDDADVKIESPMAAALERIAEIAAATHEMAAATHKAASAPRRTRIIRDAKTGKPTESVSTIDG